MIRHARMLVLSVSLLALLMAPVPALGHRLGPGTDLLSPSPTPAASVESTPPAPSDPAVEPQDEASEPAPRETEPAAPALSTDAQTFKCQNGMAGPFPCSNVDVESILPLGGAGAGNGNDVWGWTDPKTGKEYALLGSALVTTFIDVSDPKNPRTVGALPTSGVPDLILWRDIKVDGNYAFIVAEHRNHGMQVFDLTRLRDAGPAPEVFTADAVYRGTDENGVALGASHNVAINEATNFAYVVGSNTCVSGPGGQRGGLHMVDISKPLEPTFAGCALVNDPPTHNYSHDVQCVVYRGPDADYRGREICFGSNEEVVVVYDVTNKKKPVVISQWGYPQASYAHQGWLTSDHRYFLFGDEGDEIDGTVTNTATYIMDAADLDRPKVPKVFLHETNSIDHNLYIKGDLVYQANYAAGLRVLQATNASLSKGTLNEVGFLDIRPGVDAPEFVGTWSNYPYFKSGIVLLTGIEEGSSVLYVLRPTGPAAVERGGEGAGGKTGGGQQGGGNGGGQGGGGAGGGAGGDESGEGSPGAAVGGAGLAATGAQIMLFVLAGLGLIATGVAIQRSRRRETGVDSPG